MAQVTGDTVAGLDCNSTASENIVERHEDGSTTPLTSDTWEAKREVELEARGKGKRRKLTLHFWGDGGPSLAPTAARDHFDDRDEPGGSTWRRTTVTGESSVKVRLHVGEHIIQLGLHKPDFDDEVGVGLGMGVGIWHVTIPLRKHIKALRAHESKKGRRSRVSFTYKFPGTTLVRNESYGTGTKNWSSASCTLRSRRFRVGGF